VLSRFDKLSMTEINPLALSLSKGASPGATPHPESLKAH